MLWYYVVYSADPISPDDLLNAGPMIGAQIQIGIKVEPTTNLF